MMKLLLVLSLVGFSACTRFDGGYELLLNKECTEDNDKEYKSFSSAKRACDAQPNCKYIVNDDCDGEEFNICTSGSALRSDDDDCVYKKGSRTCNGGSKLEMQECCSRSNPCGLGQGNCSGDIECAGDLQCGINNCGPEFLWRGADCCQNKQV